MMTAILVALLVLSQPQGDDVRVLLNAQRVSEDVGRARATRRSASHRGAELEYAATRDGTRQ